MKYKEENPKLMEELTAAKQQLKEKDDHIMELTTVINNFTENLEEKNIYEKYNEAMKQANNLKQ